MPKAKRRTHGRGNSFGDFVKSEPELTVLTDGALRREEVSKVFEHDPFNFRYKLGPVYDILRYKDPPDRAKQDSRTPMAILISGGWGTGKTSAMQWLDCLLRQWNQTGNGIRVHPVWFYPWKYDKKEDVWRGLLPEHPEADLRRGRGQSRDRNAGRRALSQARLGQMPGAPGYERR
jgi:hypothetical protein